MKKHWGFSLLEMLVAITIFMLLMLLILEALHFALQLLKKIDYSQEAAHEASSTLQLMARDWEMAAITTNSESLFFNIPIKDQPSCTNFFFLANIPREGRMLKDLGELHAVGYFLVPNKNNQRKELYRFMAGSEETLQALRQNQLLKLYQTASPSDQMTCERVASDLVAFQSPPLYLFSKKKKFRPS